MARKCSHCGRIGHNSRTCNIYINKLGGGAAGVSISTTSTSYPTTNCISSNSITTTIPSAGGLKLFGIQLTNPSFSSNSNFSNGGTSTAIRKSFSLDSFHAACCTTSSSSPSSSSKSLSPSSSFSTNSISRIHVDELLDYRSSAINGYLITQPQERKKGVPWTEEEHRTFLIGLEKLGKGDWRGISKKFVPTRTPTQVASHAQKYFLRQATLNKKRHRSSLFDDTIGRSRIGATLTSRTIFPNTNITATTAHFSSNFKSELNHVEQFHHQLRYNNNSWQVKDLCLDSSNSPTRGSTATVPPRPRRSNHLQHQAPLDLQLTLRVPGLPPTRRESSKQHSVLVGTV